MEMNCVVFSLLMLFGHVSSRVDLERLNRRHPYGYLSSANSNVDSEVQRPKTTFYSPCKSHIVFAMDDPSQNPYFENMKSFWLNRLFSTKWTHFERLNIMFLYKQDSYRHYDRQTSVGKFSGRDLKSVQSKISEFKNESYGDDSKLPNVLRNLVANFDPSKQYPTINYIVFVSKINQSIVDESKKFAAQLGVNGRLSLIAVGNIDPRGDLMSQLTPYYTQWTNPKSDPFFNKWENFFWQTAYGCDNDPMPFDYTMNPCSGQINILMDTTSSLTSDEFYMQSALVGRKLFTDYIFSNYQRLSIGNYTNMEINTQSFQVETNAANVTDYVDSVEQCVNCTANLRKALFWIYSKEYEVVRNETTTYVVFVSKVDQNEIKGAQFAAQQISKQKVRLVLIPLGNMNTTVLGQITGNPKLVFEMPSETVEVTTPHNSNSTIVKTTPSNGPNPINFEKWLGEVMDCPQN